MLIKNKLNNLSGLQRIFLVSFILSWIYFAFWGALIEADNLNEGNREYRWAVSRDFQNPACLPYTTKPMHELTQPEYGSKYGGSCWHIYTHRKYNEDAIKLPLTEKSYNNSESWDTFENFMMHLGIKSTIIIFAFLTLFGGYKLIKWIIAGFKKS